MTFVYNGVWPEPSIGGGGHVETLIRLIEAGAPMTMDTLVATLRHPGCIRVLAEKCAGIVPNADVWDVALVFTPVISDESVLALYDCWPYETSANLPASTLGGEGQRQSGTAAPTTTPPSIRIFPELTGFATGSEVFMDLETTSSDVRTCEIIQVGMICRRDVRRQTADEIRRLNLFAKPSVPMCAAVISHHGITNEFMADKPPFGDIAPQIAAFFRECPAPIRLIAHNGSRFDFPVLERHMRAALPAFSMPSSRVDTLAMANRLRGRAKGRNTQQALKENLLGERDHSKDHDAIVDCEYLVRIYYKLLELQLFPRLPTAPRVPRAPRAPRRPPAPTPPSDEGDTDDISDILAFVKKANSEAVAAAHRAMLEEREDDCVIVDVKPPAAVAAEFPRKRRRETWSEESSDSGSDNSKCPAAPLPFLPPPPSPPAFKRQRRQRTDPVDKAAELILLAKKGAHEGQPLGITMIFPAGGGKTTALLTLATRLSEHQMDKPLLLTYNKALQEATARAARTKGIAVDVMTIHAFAGKVIGKVVPDDRRLTAELDNICARAASSKNRYSCVFVDEAQDLTPEYARVVHAAVAAAHTPLVLVGDPRQCVYEFNNASVEYLLHPERHFGTSLLPRSWTRITSTVSRRLPADIAHFVNTQLGSDRQGGVEIDGSNGNAGAVERIGLRDVDGDGAVRVVDLMIEYGPGNVMFLWHHLPGVDGPMSDVDVSTPLGRMLRAVRERYNRIVLPGGLPPLQYQYRTHKATTASSRQSQKSTANADPNQPIVSTFCSAKGLECSVAVVFGVHRRKYGSLFDCHDDGTRIPNGVYVACTRPRNKLILVLDQRNAPYTFSPPSGASVTNILCRPEDIGDFDLETRVTVTNLIQFRTPGDIRGLLDMVEVIAVNKDGRGGPRAAEGEPVLSAAAEVCRSIMPPLQICGIVVPIVVEVKYHGTFQRIFRLADEYIWDKLIRGCVKLIAPGSALAGGMHWVSLRDRARQLICDTAGATPVPGTDAAFFSDVFALLEGTRGRASSHPLGSRAIVIRELARVLQERSTTNGGGDGDGREFAADIISALEGFDAVSSPEEGIWDYVLLTRRIASEQAADLYRRNRSAFEQYKRDLMPWVQERAAVLHAHLLPAASSSSSSPRSPPSIRFEVEKEGACVHEGAICASEILAVPGDPRHPDPLRRPHYQVPSRASWVAAASGSFCTGSKSLLSQQTIRIVGRADAIEVGETGDKIYEFKGSSAGERENPEHVLQLATYIALSAPIRRRRRREEEDGEEVPLPPRLVVGELYNFFSDTAYQVKVPHPEQFIGLLLAKYETWRKRL